MAANSGHVPGVYDNRGGRPPVPRPKPLDILSQSVACPLVLFLCFLYGWSAPTISRFAAQLRSQSCMWCSRQAAAKAAAALALAPATLTELVVSGNKLVRFLVLALLLPQLKQQNMCTSSSPRCVPSPALLERLCLQAGWANCINVSLFPLIAHFF